jgi:hypothetical protein
MTVEWRWKTGKKYGQKMIQIDNANLFKEIVVQSKNLKTKMVVS